MVMIIRVMLVMTHGRDGDDEMSMALGDGALDLMMIMVRIHGGDNANARKVGDDDDDDDDGCCGCCGGGHDDHVMMMS
jgi:hypothetical protein